MSDSEVYNLIFEAGFSTSEKITDVSGRGVGMDVVRRAVESLKGRIEIESTLGKGSSFSLHLPLTLAITDGMLVRVGDQRYLIPTVNMQQSFRPESKQLATIGGGKGELVILRGAPVPLFRLHRLFNVTGAREKPTEALVVVVGDANGQAAILVDELLEQRQVVAKSLGDGNAEDPRGFRGRGARRRNGGPDPRSGRHRRAGEHGRTRRRRLNRRARKG
jgi:two-component system chemotaxis sensor kinase CheA